VGYSSDENDVDSRGSTMSPSTAPTSPITSTFRSAISPRPNPTIASAINNNPNPTSASASEDDPNSTIPLTRYNAMLAVLRNTLYIYGGIFERGSREYTLDDFHSLQLDKLDRYTCLKHSGVVIAAEGEDESSEDDDEDDEDDEDDGDDSDEDDGDGGDLPSERKALLKAARLSDGEAAEEEVSVEVATTLENPVTEDELRSQVEEFMRVSKDTTRSAEDVLSTPLPGETLAIFYARSREYWAGKAHESTENRGKALRRDGFALAQERYEVYKPILKEVERILEEAGLDEEEMKRGAAAGPAASGQSRNRR